MFNWYSPTGKVSAKRAIESMAQYVDLTHTSVRLTPLILTALPFPFSYSGQLGQISSRAEIFSASSRDSALIPCSRTVSVEFRKLSMRMFAR